MEDEPSPPRRVFGFAPREFVRANRPAGRPPQHDTPPDPDAESIPATDKPIEACDMARNASGEPPFKANLRADRENEVHGILRFNVARDRAHGWYDVELGRNKKRRVRIRNYVLALIAINMPLGLIAWLSGHTDPFPFVFAIAGMSYLSARVTWETWFLRTE